jgi:hypothetical protein
LFILFWRCCSPLTAAVGAHLFPSLNFHTLVEILWRRNREWQASLATKTLLGWKISTIAHFSFLRHKWPLLVYHVNSTHAFSILGFFQRTGHHDFFILLPNFSCNQDTFMQITT